MAFLKTKYEKKSFWVTTALMLWLLAMLFFFGLRYLDPPIENGILIAFGAEVNGNTAQDAAPQTVSNNEIVTQNKVPTEILEPLAPPKSQVVPAPAPEEVLVTSESEVVVAPTTPKASAVQRQEAVETTVVEKETPKKEVVKEVKKEASAATKAALANILGAKEAKGTGVGTTENNANQGLSDGSRYANSYYGSTKGDLNGVGFGLAGRSLVAKGAVTPDCIEQGRVVVAITVNKLGVVVAADPGVKGTTNNAPCLLAPARATAMRYKWAPDPQAPEQQIGFVVINFKLGQN